MPSVVIILLIVAAIFIGAVGLHFYKQYKIRQLQRMKQNEYEMAVTIWDYARLVKSEIDEAIHTGTGVIDFTRITVPHSQGYRVAIELIGSYFRIYATPEKYARTGLLSFVTDNTLTVKAADHAGAQAASDDPEYKGDSVE